MATSNLRFRIIGEDDASRAFLQVAAASKLLKSNLDDVGSSALGLTKLIGGAGLIPVAAGAAAAVTELTVAAAAGAGALGALGLSVGGIAHDMVKQKTAMAVTAKSLTTLTKGTQAYRDKLAELHLQQKTFNQDFGPAASGLADVQRAFGWFKDQTRVVTLNVMAKAFTLLTSLLPRLVPIANAAGKAVEGLLTELTVWTRTPEFQSILDWFRTSGPKAITAFGESVGHLVHGLGELLSNFVGPGDHAAKTLEHLSKSFDHWAGSKGVSKSIDSFLKYVGDNGPALSSAFGSLAEASPKIAVALGQLGSLNLTLTGKFLSLVAGLPQKQFNLIADGLFAMAAGAKALTLVTGLKAIGTGLVGIASGKGLAGKSGGILGGATSAAGVQKVYVVNMPPGGVGGGGVPGVPGGESPGGGNMSLLTKLGLGGLGLGALAGIDVGSQQLLNKLYGQFVGGVFGKLSRALINLPDPSLIGQQKKLWESFFKNGPAGAMNTLGIPQHHSTSVSPSDVPGAALSVAARNGATGLQNSIPHMKAASTAVEALVRNLGHASQGMDLVGHSANRAFPGAQKQVESLSGKLATINGSKASAAMDLVGHSAATNFLKASGQADNFKGKLDGIPANKNVKVNADTGAALAGVSNVQNHLNSLHDKTVTIYTNLVTRHMRGTTYTTGGHTVGGGAGGGGMGSGSGGSGTSGSGGARDAGRETGAELMRGIVDGIGSHFVLVGHALDKVAAYLQKQKQKLQSLTSTRNQFASGFQSFAGSAFGADYGTDASGSPVAPTIASILQYQSSQRSTAATVRTDVHKLLKMGLSPALLKQLQAAGPAGLPVIEALAGATRKQIQQYNALNKATQHDLRVAGMAAGNAIYGKQIVQTRNNEDLAERIAKKLHREMQSAGKHEYAVIKVNGNELVRAIRKDKHKRGKSSSV